MTNREYYDKIQVNLNSLDKNLQRIYDQLDIINDYVKDIAIHTGYDKYVIDYIKGNISNGEED